MKTLASILLLLSFALPAFGELTREDLRQIEEIVQKSEARMKEYVDIKIATLDTKFSTKIDELNTKFSIKFDEFDKRQQIIFAVLIALMALVAGAIVIPQVIIAFKEKGTASLQEQINQLRQKVETLEQSRVVRP